MRSEKFNNSGLLTFKIDLSLGKRKSPKITKKERNKKAIQTAFGLSNAAIMNIKISNGRKKYFNCLNNKYSIS